MSLPRPLRAPFGRLAVCAALVLCLPSFAAKPKPAPELVNRERLDALLRPHRTDLATLSRDGAHLAYAVTEGRVTRIAVVSTTAPYASESIYLGDLAESRLTALEWVSPTRLVFSTENWLIAVADLGRPNARIVLDPSTFVVKLPSGSDDPEAQEFSLACPPRLLRFAHHTADRAFVEGVAGTNLRDTLWITAAVDLNTGELHPIQDVRIAQPAMRAVADREGNIRLLADRVRLPIRWSSRKSKAHWWSSWESLSAHLPEDLKTSFNFDAEHLAIDHSLPLGFDENPDVMLFASNVGRSTYGIYGVNIVTGARTDLVVEDDTYDLIDPAPDLIPAPIGDYERRARRGNAGLHYTDFRATLPPSPLILDRTSGALAGVQPAISTAPPLWLDPTLKRVQQELDRAFTERRITLVDWDDARTRFLFRADTLRDPGRYYVYERNHQTCVEYLRRNPGLPVAQLHPVEEFVVKSADGHSLSGRLTVPLHPLVTPAPLICLFPDSLWRTPATDYSATAQMLAEFGCMVLQVDYSGSSGWGLGPWQAARAAPEQTALQELTSALKWVKQTHPYSARRIAAVGSGYGAWLALRTAQIAPSLFRSVVALNSFDTLADYVTAPPERELEEGSRALQQANLMVDYMEAINRDLHGLTTNGGSSSSQSSDEGGNSSDSSGQNSGNNSGNSGGEASGSESTTNHASRLAVFNQILDANEPSTTHFPRELARWYFGASALKSDDHSVIEHADDLKAAVLLCQDADNLLVRNGDAKKLQRRLNRLGRSSELFEVPASPWNRPIEQRPEVWLRVAEFFNESLYNFDSQIGETREIK